MFLEQLTVHDASGQKIQISVKAHQNAGEQEVHWDANFFSGVVYLTCFTAKSRNQ
jgi:hypothetical protein